MTLAMPKKMTPSPPNSSTLRVKEATGQLMTPQNSATSPTAAAKDGSIPSNGPTTQPKVAPTKKVGTISPPLKPAPSVRAVSRSLNKKAYQSASPCWMTCMPAPLKSLVPISRLMATTIRPPHAARSRRFGKTLA